jgi:hypothetical protein
MSIFCEILGHKRSRTRVFRHQDGHFKSVCRRCELPMVKTDSGKWRLVDDDRAQGLNEL